MFEVLACTALMIYKSISLSNGLDIQELLEKQPPSVKDHRVQPIGRGFSFLAPALYYRIGSSRK